MRTTLSIILALSLRRTLKVKIQANGANLSEILPGRIILGQFSTIIDKPNIVITPILAPNEPKALKYSCTLAAISIHSILYRSNLTETDCKTICLPFEFAGRRNTVEKLRKAGYLSIFGFHPKCRYAIIPSNIRPNKSSTLTIERFNNIEKFIETRGALSIFADDSNNPFCTNHKCFAIKKSVETMLLSFLLILLAFLMFQLVFPIYSFPKDTIRVWFVNSRGIPLTKPPKISSSAKKALTHLLAFNSTISSAIFHFSNKDDTFLSSRINIVRISSSIVMAVIWEEEFFSDFSYANCKFTGNISYKDDEYSPKQSEAKIINPSNEKQYISFNIPFGNDNGELRIIPKTRNPDGQIYEFDSEILDDILLSRILFHGTHGIEKCRKLDEFMITSLFRSDSDFLGLYFVEQTGLNTKRLKNIWKASKNSEELLLMGRFIREVYNNEDISRDFRSHHIGGYSISYSHLYVRDTIILIIRFLKASRVIYPLEEIKFISIIRAMALFYFAGNNHINELLLISRIKALIDKTERIATAFMFGPSYFESHGNIFGRELDKSFVLQIVNSTTKDQNICIHDAVVQISASQYMNVSSNIHFNSATGTNIYIFFATDNSSKYVEQTQIIKLFPTINQISKLLIFHRILNGCIVSEPFSLAKELENKNPCVFFENVIFQQNLDSIKRISLGLKALIRIKQLLGPPVWYVALPIGFSGSFFIFTYLETYRPDNRALNSNEIRYISGTVSKFLFVSYDPISNYRVLLLSSPFLFSLWKQYIESRRLKAVEELESDDFATVIISNSTLEAGISNWALISARFITEKQKEWFWSAYSQTESYQITLILFDFDKAKGDLSKASKINATFNSTIGDERRVMNWKFDDAISPIRSYAIMPSFKNQIILNWTTIDINVVERSREALKGEIRKSLKQMQSIDIVCGFHFADERWLLLRGSVGADGKLIGIGFDITTYLEQISSLFPLFSKISWEKR